MKILSLLKVGHPRGVFYGTFKLGNIFFVWEGIRNTHLMVIWRSRSNGKIRFVRNSEFSESSLVRGNMIIDGGREITCRR